MAGYTRQDTGDNIATGKVINASDFDNEFNAIQTAFNNSSGHNHDGTAAEGARVTVIGNAGQVNTDGTTIFSTSNAVVGLGKTGNVWKDLHIDSIVIDGSSITTIGTNTDLSLTPVGSGSVIIPEGVLKIGSQAVTSTGDELNILDGSATTQATVTLEAADGVVISDGDVMKQALVSDFSVFTASSTQTLTNKTIDANGTNNSITNLEVADFASGVLDTDLSAVSSGDTTLASAKAIKTYVDSGTATLTNKTIDANGTNNSITNLEVADFIATAIVTESEGLDSSDNDTSLPTTAAVKDYVDTKDMDSGADYGSSSNPHVFIVTVASKTAAHPYHGHGSSSGYYINGKQSPVIELNGHDQTSEGEYYYKFLQKDSSNSGHQLVFYEDAAKSKSFAHAKLSTQVTFGSGTAGDTTDDAWVMIKVCNDTPNKLYYQCNAHALMGNHVKTGNLSPGINDHHTIEMGNLKFTNSKIETIDNNTTGSTNSGHALILDTFTNASGDKEPIQADTWMKVYGNAGGTSSHVQVGLASGGGDDLIVTGTTPSLVIHDLTNDSSTDRGELNYQSVADDGSNTVISKIQGYHKTQTGTQKGGLKILASTDNSNNFIEAITVDGDGVGLMSTHADPAIAVMAAGTGGFYAKKYISQNVTVTSAANVTLNGEDGNNFQVTMGHSITFIFSNPPPVVYGYRFIVKLKQDGTGNRTATWPGTVDWAGGTTPTLSTAANAVDIFEFLTMDNGTTYYGFTLGLDMK